MLIFPSAYQEVSALPYQLLESPSAILAPKGGQEIKADYSLETAQIPTEILLLHYRYGVTTAMEVSGEAVYAHFTDQQLERIAELQAAVKFRIPATLIKSGALGYVSFRESLGDPVIVNYQGSLNNVGSVVSRHADGGRDLSAGILGRSQVGQYSFTMGAQYTYAANRSYGDFTSSQSNVYTLYFTPERHFLKETLMVALENRYTYWENRGDFYDALPQVRWEFIKHWVVESGVSIPVIGGQTYRYIIGLTYEY